MNPRPDWLEPDDVESDEVRRHLEDARAYTWNRRIPQRYRDVDLDGVDAAVRGVLAEWATAPLGRNVVLLGPVGVGKTAAAVAACRSAHFRYGLDVRFACVVDLLDALRPGGDGQQVLDALADADRLILDDLGAERQTGWTAERVNALIDRRWRAEAPTVVTTNLAPDDLADAVGERCFSRLVGSGALVLRLTGPDRRRQR